MLRRADLSAERADTEVARAVPCQPQEDMRLNPDAEVHKWLHYVVRHSTAAYGGKGYAFGVRCLCIPLTSVKVP